MQNGITIKINCRFVWEKIPPHSIRDWLCCFESLNGTIITYKMRGGSFRFSIRNRRQITSIWQHHEARRTTMSAAYPRCLMSLKTHTKNCTKTHEYYCRQWRGHWRRGTVLFVRRNRPYETWNAKQNVVQNNRKHEPTVRRDTATKHKKLGNCDISILINKTHNVLNFYHSKEISTMERARVFGNDSMIALDTLYMVRVFVTFIHWIMPVNQYLLQSFDHYPTRCTQNKKNKKRPRYILKFNGRLWYFSSLNIPIKVNLFMNDEHVSTIE